jgi:Protein of unknown function (DUF4199)
MNRTDNILAIKFGVIAGLLFAGLCFGCWAAGMNAFASFLIWYTWLPVIFALFLIGAFQKRRQLGGYMSFKEAMVFAFLAYVIYEVFYAIVTLVLFKIVDPQLQDKVLVSIMDKTRAFMEKMGAQDSTIEDALNKAQQNNKETYSIKQIFIGFGTSIIYDFVKSIIIAAISQRRKPEFAETKESNP